MQNDNNKDVQNTESIQTYLEKMYEKGTELFVDGEMVLPYEAYRRTVREEFSYMADYVLGESGKVEQIRFDKVSLR